MAESIREREEEIIEEFEFFPDWMEKYEHLIEQYKKEENLIKGCQSRVWLHADREENKILFSADSDAIITKGIVALMIRVLNNQKPEDIVSAQLSFIDQIGLKEHLSPTRSNGLVSMVKQMKFYALAHQAKQ
jgi:cysteine desulfuration protein SufE